MHFCESKLSLESSCEIISYFAGEPFEVSGGSEHGISPMEWETQQEMGPIQKYPNI